MFDSSRTALIAKLPNCPAPNDDKEPPSEPTGVLFADVITTFFIL